ncbi:LemA family protein [Mycolicibacillus parakoreensis]|uniref:LemA family protein n=1 Tax=Mycolicibacillus parakoreensis TaxID=1069221 RepID=A0ABY3TVE1_9MYCO|nr:LemA family protein [Mycolicibacillus parakoreensis]MCV7316799.1 LemA family protein [Mycolicibacillus parakoreensis]ULN51167.1 LemA family protein [Mycolicibacillus parakoreensis]HLR98643.1 LemA family protein [Mycolicibacillus parakoreensis]
MSTTSTAVLLIAILVALIGVVWFGVSAFNALRRLDVTAQEALGGIDVQLTRRADLIPNLVTTVQGYAAHERAVFDEVTAARAGAAAAAGGGTVEQKAQAQDRLDRAVLGVLAVAENYPDLKASTNFLQLQDQLADTENQLAFARQYYNDAVATLNQRVVTIPWMFFVGVAGVTRRPFYQAPEGQQTPPQVRF